jgi:hypothetical protein
MLATDNRPARLPQLSGDLSAYPSEDLTTALETILWFQATYVTGILDVLRSRAGSSETLVCCEEFDHVPMSVWCRIEKYLK